MEERTIERIMKDEYELQHFGFSSTDFLIQFQDIINTRITENMIDLKRSFAKRYSSYEGVLDELNELENALKESSRENVINNQAFRDKVRDIFEIPDNILLPNDEIHYEDFSEDAVDALTKEIEELEKQYKKDELLIKLYDQEIERINELNPIQETFTKVTEHVKEWPKLTKYKKNVEEVNDLLNLENELKKTFEELFDSYEINSQEMRAKMKECVISDNIIDLEDY